MESETAARAHPGGEAPLCVTSLPRKTSYARGERISYRGAVFSADGEEVTDRVAFDPAEGSVWPSDWKKREARVTYRDGAGNERTASFPLKRRKGAAPVLLASALAVALVGVALAGAALEPRGDVGSYVIPQGEMPEEEVRALLDRQTEESRIAISLASSMLLQADGRLRLNFTVAEGNNGFSERVELFQDGVRIYRSGVVEPGYGIEWADVPRAHSGDITATVYAVRPGEGDYGNPVSVETVVVDEGESGNQPTGVPKGSA